MCRPDKGYVTVSPTFRRPIGQMPGSSLGIASIAISAEAVAECAASTIGYVLRGRSAAAILTPSNATGSSRERMNRGDLGETRELLKAVTDAESGVLTWLKTVW